MRRMNWGIVLVLVLDCEDEDEESRIGSKSGTFVARRMVAAAEGESIIKGSGM